MLPGTKATDGAGPTSRARLRARLGATPGAAMLAALAMGSLGCPRFQPTLPMHARTGDVDLALASVGFRGPQIVLTSRSTAPHTLLRAWLTVPARSPCAGGLEADALTVDDGRAPAGTLMPGTHTVALWFPEGSLNVTLDLVADLELEDGGCLRAPVVSQTIPLVPARRPVLVVSTGLVGNADLSGLRAVTSLEIGAGAWLGHVLVNAQAGVGAAICTAAVCGMDSQGQLHSGVAVPLALEARYAFGGGISGKLESAWFVGGRYAFEPVWLPAIGGERALRVHTLEAMLGWGFGDAVPGPVRQIERAVPFELVVPLGIAVAPGAPDRRVAFTGGFAVRFLFGLPR